MNVSAPAFGNAQRITLRLITPGKFGDEVYFIPEGGSSFNAFARLPIAEEWMLRAHDARTERAADGMYTRARLGVAGDFMLATASGRYLRPETIRTSAGKLRPAPWV
jgi:hypothetical protein